MWLIPPPLHPDIECPTGHMREGTVGVSEGGGICNFWRGRGVGRIDVSVISDSSKETGNELSMCPNARGVITNGALG